MKGIRVLLMNLLTGSPALSCPPILSISVQGGLELQIPEALTVGIKFGVSDVRKYVSFIYPRAWAEASRANARCRRGLSVL